MKSTKEFPFDKARRVTSSEVSKARRAIEKATGQSRPKRLGRPPKSSDQKHIPISIRLHLTVLKWLKREANKRQLPYQTIINQILMQKFAA
jgi:predicted DNA binding CopG/RHH family protein